MNPAADLQRILAGPLAVGATLWPGLPQALAVRGIYDAPTELADVGGEVKHVTYAPSFHLGTQEAAGLKRGDQVEIEPRPALGVPGGTYEIKNALPDGTGVTILELMEA